MKRPITTLALRRRLLLDKIGAQRSELAQLTSHFERPLAWADNGLRAAHYLHDHPALLAASLAAFLSLRRSGLLGLANRSWRLLFLYPALINFAWPALSPSLRRVITRCKTPTKKGT